MTARTQDIRFACDHCGQRIVVDATAAGAETACPGCHRPMVIPTDGEFADRESITALAGRGNGASRSVFPDGSARVEALEREISASRKEIARLQEQLRALGEERAALRASGAAESAKRQQAIDDLELARERVKALETEAAAMQSHRTVAERELTEARAEIVRLQEESSLHRRNFDEARARLTVAETEAQRAAALETELQSVEEKWTTAMADAQRLEQRGEKLRAELQSAQRELVQTESGRALTELRGRFGETDEERKRLASQLSEVQREARRLADGEREWRTQFDAMRRQRDEALRRADASSDSALQHGNDVLRGILDRQKMELDERYTELRRLRGAQLSLRILYVLAGLLLLVAIVVGLQAVHGMWR